MQEAANQFKIDFDVRNADCRHSKTREMAEKIKQSPTQPDYIVLTDDRAIGDEFMHILQNTNIRFVLLNEGFDNEEKSKLKIPKNRILGALLPDYTLAASELMELLAEKASEIKIGKFCVLVFTGVGVNRSSEEIMIGVHNVQKRNKSITGVEQKNEVEGEDGASFIKAKLKQNVGIVITYSYTATEKVIEVAEANGLKPGVDFVIGSFGFTPTNVNYLKQNKVAAIAGGNEKAGAAVIAHIFDDTQNLVERAMHDYVFDLKIVSNAKEIKQLNCTSFSFKAYSQKYTSHFSIEQFKVD